MAYAIFHELRHRLRIDFARILIAETVGER
jgi:hypothetical protein